MATPALFRRAHIQGAALPIDRPPSVGASPVSSSSGPGLVNLLTQPLPTSMRVVAWFQSRQFEMTRWLFRKADLVHHNHAMPTAAASASIGAVLALSPFSHGPAVAHESPHTEHATHVEKGKEHATHPEAPSRPDEPDHGPEHPPHTPETVDQPTMTRRRERHIPESAQRTDREVHGLHLDRSETVITGDHLGEEIGFDVRTVRHAGDASSTDVRSAFHEAWRQEALARYRTMSDTSAGLV